jgi:hypothetical protein
MADELSGKFFDELIELIKQHRGSVPPRPATTPAPEPTHPTEEDTDDIDLVDQRFRSKKIYYLSEGAEQHTNKIPKVPGSARRVFGYLRKYEVGTVKQIAHTLNLEKKTIGNALAALVTAGLVDRFDLPKQ